MTKRKCISDKIEELIIEFGDSFEKNGESEVNKTLFCRLCKVNISCKKVFNLTQHLSLPKHMKNMQECGESKGQYSQKEFNQDLSRLFIRNCYPTKTLNSKEWKRFTNKYTEYQCPEETTIRKYYMPSLYDSTLDKILHELKDRDIWLSIDETKDRKSRHVMVGRLDYTKPNISYLLNTEFPDEVNNITINQIIINSLNMIWTNGIKYHRFLLLLTDGVSYMRTCGENLKAFFPKLIHLICLCHNLHNLSESVAKLYPNIQKFMISSNMVFSKSDKNKKIIKDNGLKVPPKLITTRWGSYFDCLEYFINNLDEFDDY